MNTTRLREMTRATLCGALILMTGCNVLLDTTECVTDGDCERFVGAMQAGSCVNNTCVIIDVSAPECTMDAECMQGERCDAQRCVTMQGMDMDPVDMARVDMTIEPVEMGPVDMGPEQEVVEGKISGLVTWSRDKVYVLQGLVTIENQAVLTIQSGTTILGEENSALIVRRGGKLLATGRADAPIVFTSARPSGQRSPGDWGGVAMLGSAPVNESNPKLEGVPIDLPYGGPLSESGCGKLEYVRIEFAGFELATDKELNGLTLAGCGKDTFIDYVQVHRGKDDGLEIFGGTVDIKHVVLSGAQDDSLDIDKGWQGSGQFIAIIQDDGGDFAIEASSSKAQGATPRTSPYLYNLTMASPKGNDSGAVLFKEGVGGLYSNMIVLSYDLFALSVDSAESAMLTADVPPGLVVKESMFFEIGSPGGDGTAYWPGSTPDFDEEMYFADGMWNNVFGVDPGLSNPYDLTGPDLTSPLSQVISGAAAPVNRMGESIIDEDADYYGAFAPGEPSWLGSWTAFPPN